MSASEPSRKHNAAGSIIMEHIWRRGASFSEPSRIGKLEEM
jgi:hypothetical protein